MPRVSLLRSFLALWILTGVVLFVLGVATVQDAWNGPTHINPHLMLVGGFESAAAMCFIIPRTFRVGAFALLATISIAFIVHAALGEFRGDLLIYGLVVLFVLVHGPLTELQWKAAISRPAV